jgi:peptidyl-tRNA hydrolase
MVLKQIVFLRSDLKNYGKGALIAQACHATTYATFKYTNHPDTIEYLKNITEMTKIILKITSEDITDLSDALNASYVDFVEWRESPEDIVTCLCTRPFVLDDYPDLRLFILRFKLF